MYVICLDIINITLISVMIVLLVNTMNDIYQTYENMCIGRLNVVGVMLNVYLSKQC